MSVVISKCVNGYIIHENSYNNQNSPDTTKVIESSNHDLATKIGDAVLELFKLRDGE